MNLCLMKEAAKDKLTLCFRNPQGTADHRHAECSPPAGPFLRPCGRPIGTIPSALLTSSICGPSPFTTMQPSGLCAAQESDDAEPGLVLFRLEAGAEFGGLG